MEKKDLNRLNHILDAAKAIQKHIKGKKQSDLDDDRLFLGGVIRELLLIGEAANFFLKKMHLTDHLIL